MTTNDQHKDDAVITNVGDKTDVNAIESNDAKTVFRKPMPSKVVDEKPADDAKTVFRKPISKSKADEIALSVAKAKATAKAIRGKSFRG